MNPEVLTAYHEAGHSVSALLRGISIRTCTIEPGRNSWGHVASSESLLVHGSGDLVVFSLAGGASETRHTGRLSIGDSEDLEWARFLVSLEMKTEPEDIKVTKRLETYRTLAAAEVASNWDWISKVARKLLHKRTLSGSDVADCM